MISTSTRLPLCLLQLDLLKTCLLGRYIQAFLTWRSMWCRQVAPSLLSRWSLPLDHFCLRRNSRISWWNSPLTINRIFFASSHNKYPLSLAWSQHWSNMSCANTRHPDVSIVVIRLLEYRFSNVSKHRPSARSWKGLMGEGFINPTVPTQWLWVGWFLTWGSFDHFWFWALWRHIPRSISKYDIRRRHKEVTH